MRGSHLLLPIMAALALAGCMRHGPTNLAAVPKTYAAAPAPGSERGLFNMSHRAQAYAQRPAVQPPIVMQYHPPREVVAQEPPPRHKPVPRYVAPRVLPPAAPEAYAYAPAVSERPYTLDAGDKLRVVVFGQEGISNSYLVDAGGNVSLPLIGSVPARGHTTQQLAHAIAGRLKQGYVRDPHVSVEVEAYRPFFILGEVTTPGQYPYVANMTVEKAVAIAGGFSPRAYKYKVELTRTARVQQVRSEVPLDYPVRPGDTVMVKERWF